MIITTEKIPIKLWLDDIEDGALEQAKNLANLPFAFKHIAIMPDSHRGYGMPIGGVIATKGVIIPNAVGVDIGCGMCVIKTSLTDIDLNSLKKIMGQIRKTIPLGMNKHKEEQDESLMPNLEQAFYEVKTNNMPICCNEYSNAKKSLGTLGGGNHFIEIQKGDDNHIWIMIHSGSRNLGKQVAEYYNKLAYTLNKKWHSNTYLPSNPSDSLAFFPLDSDEGKDYITEMQYCVDFALANRKLMVERVKKIFVDVLSDNGTDLPEDIDLFDDIINIAHNYAKMENHFGQNVMVHRKGATLASTDTIGIIPGSQGTNSYIVRGLGNPDSFNSCSHGAGRKMGRKDAEKRLNLQDEIKMLDDQGILHAIRGRADLEEAPSAYKDVDVVMKNQKDLVEMLIKLTPLGVIKG